MIGLMQIMIYLLCVYLIYKGVEIFQIAFVSGAGKAKVAGIVIGVLAVIGAFGVGAGAIYMTESIVARVGSSMDKMPNLR